LTVRGFFGRPVRIVASKGLKPSMRQAGDFCNEFLTQDTKYTVS